MGGTCALDALDRQAYNGKYHPPAPGGSALRLAAGAGRWFDTSGGKSMDVEGMVSAAWLELRAAEGRRLTRAERQELEAYRLFLTATAAVCRALDEDPDAVGLQLSLWDD